MSDADLLLNRLRKFPEDKILAGAAADALYESGEYTRRDALKTVAKTRRPVIQAREMTRALGLIRCHSPRRRRLANFILYILDFPAGSQCTIHIVSGSRPPSLGIPLAAVPNEMEPGPAVTVGARWLLRINQAQLTRARLERDRQRGITRFR